MKRLPKVKKSSRGKMGRLADRLFSLIVRASGRCMYHCNTPCAGPLQCAHIISRTYRSIRWTESNAVALCAGAHRFFTNRPVEWRAFIANTHGEGFWDEMERCALQVWDKDLDGVLVRLAARAVSLNLPVPK